jgi:chemotaxis protein methyltransferase CheR
VSARTYSDDVALKAYQSILAFIEEQRGVDFHAYRPSTIGRRLAFRLSTVGMPDFSSYLAYVKKTPAELDSLIDSLTIKVSSFFRNPLVFEILREMALPELIEAFKNEELRVWCAGCARGEEAYSIAILLKEIAEKDALSSKSFIIATDIDREVLADAERAVYKAESLLEVKKGHLDRYFVRGDSLYTVIPEIRSMLTFARHDVTSPQPPKEGIFSNYHVILCRNILIYFNRELQEKALKQVSSLLETGGVLVLGEAETMNDMNFTELIPHTKIYKKGGITP